MIRARSTAWSETACAPQSASTRNGTGSPRTAMPTSPCLSGSGRTDDEATQRHPRRKHYGVRSLIRAALSSLALCCVMAGRARLRGAERGRLRRLLAEPVPVRLWPEPPGPERAAPRAHAQSGAIRSEQDFVSSTATRRAGHAGWSARVKPSVLCHGLGDSLAILAAQGLGDAFSTKPEIAIADLARDLSGLVRDDYFDWPKAARDLIADRKADQRRPRHDGHQ